MREKCEEYAPPGGLAAVCAGCPKKEKAYTPSAWFYHIQFLFSLQRGGYPFGANDLTLDKWIDIGAMRADSK